MVRFNAFGDNAHPKIGARREHASNDCEISIGVFESKPPVFTEDVDEFLMIEHILALSHFKDDLARREAYLRCGC